MAQPTAALGYLPIADHGVIGDLRTVALVAREGSIDFLCLPRFDSPSIFLQLLDAKRGGAFSITPSFAGARTRQRYLRDTNVLLTRITAADGAFEICDFMPIARIPQPSRIVRRVRGTRGSVALRVRCAPRFDYARATHEISVRGTMADMRASDGSVMLRLVSTVGLTADGSDAVAELTLRRGEEAWFVLEHCEGERVGERDRRGLDVAAARGALAATVRFWRRWIARCRYDGPWPDVVHRSALVLKLLQYRETGALVAAPTFGLPELVGGERNWDFRYTWIRDASFTLYALLRLGFIEETREFLVFLTARCAEAARAGELQVMYRIDGRTDLAEHVLEHLDGYRGSKPVRIGNAAYDQFQLDIYGELIDALYLYDEHATPPSRAPWERMREIVDGVCANWRRADQGIWEVRSGRKPFLYSRVMCWVAVDRGIRLAERRSLPAPLSRWRAARDAIRREVYEHFWNAREQCFVAVRDSDALDASCLLMPLVQFIEAKDPRWMATLRAVERRLVSDSLVRRYDIAGMDTDAGSAGQPTFTICSFWYVECLARAGELTRARAAFEQLLAHANHLGLFSEDIGPGGEHLGNFPQGLAHLGLIGAALALATCEEPGTTTEERAEKRR